MQPADAGQLRPGLLNANTHEAIAWEDIPAANLSTTLESHVSICSNCLTIETFRREHPELVLDRHRTIEIHRMDDHGHTDGHGLI